MANNLGATEAEGLTIETLITHNAAEVYHESVSDTAILFPDSTSNLFSFSSFQFLKFGRFWANSESAFNAPPTIM